MVGLQRYGQYWLGLLVIAMVCTRAGAQLDTHLKTPYKIKVVLHIRDHRVFTPILRDQIERELGDLLRLQIGDFAKVEISTQHSRLTDILSKGLQQGLDRWNDLDEWQTHFVIVSYERGKYQISSRFHEGMTGLNSGPVIKIQTAYREGISQRAVDLVRRQFGIVGAIAAAEPPLRMAIHGGQLSKSVQSKVRIGDVFAVVRIWQSANGLRGQRLDWSLVQVQDIPRNGWCRCRYFHRHAEDQLTADGKVIGYRCLRLAPVKAPLRLKLIHADSFQPLSGWEIHVQKFPFTGKARQLTTDSSGMVQSREKYSNMVLARVIKGSSEWAQLPVAMSADRVVVCRVKPVAGAEQFVLWEAQRDNWVNRIYDSLLAASEQIAEIKRQIPLSLKDAIHVANDAGKSVRSDIEVLASEHRRLLETARKKELAVKPVEMEEGKQGMDELKRRHAVIVDVLQKLQEAGAKTEQNKALKKELARAQVLESQALIDDAIAVYEQVVKQAPKRTAEVAKRLRALRAKWKIQSAEHHNARAFVYTVWPFLDVDELRAKLPQAKKALAILKKVDDRYSARKMDIGNLRHVVNLKKRLDALKQADTADNRAKAKLFGKLVLQFRELHREVRAFLAAEPRPSGSGKASPAP